MRNGHSNPGFKEQRARSSTNNSNNSYTTNFSDSHTASVKPLGKRNSSQILALFSSSNPSSNTTQHKTRRTYTSNVDHISEDDDNEIKGFSHEMPTEMSTYKGSSFGIVKGKGVNLEARRNSLFGTTGGASELREGRHQEEENSTLFTSNDSDYEEKENRPGAQCVSIFTGNDASQENRVASKWQNSSLEVDSKSLMFDRIINQTDENEDDFQENSKAYLFSGMRSASSSKENEDRFRGTSKSQLFENNGDKMSNGARALFNKSKKSYNTTPYLETSNHFVDSPKEWENSTTISMFEEASSNAGFGTGRERKSVMDQFEVPDVDLAVLSDELSDGVVCDFYKPNVGLSEDKLFTQSEQVCKS